MFVARSSILVPKRSPEHPKGLVTGKGRLLPDPVSRSRSPAKSPRGEPAHIPLFLQTAVHSFLGPERGDW